MMESAQATLSPSSRVKAGKTDQSVAEKLESAPTGTGMSDAQKREAMIRTEAYARYERRGFVSGHEVEDWLQAEVEVDRQLAAVPKPKKTK